VLQVAHLATGGVITACLTPRPVSLIHGEPRMQKGPAITDRWACLLNTLRAAAATRRGERDPSTLRPWPGLG
jgi:hypothetical protein